VSALNRVAGRVARRYGALVADGQTPLYRKAAAMTPIFAAEPGIHPLPIGHDGDCPRFSGLLACEDAVLTGRIRTMPGAFPLEF
jgi:hypothetical protein